MPFKSLLEVEAGLTQNEPAQMCVREAIEAAVAHLIVQGVGDGSWQLANAAEASLPIFQKYVRENTDQPTSVGSAASRNM